MKRHQESSKINESSAETTLLDNLFNFYIQKFSDQSVELVEKHFLVAVGALIDKSEISEDVVKTFLEENGIEGDIPSKKKNSYSSNNYGDPCGRSYSRSSC